MEDAATTQRDVATTHSGIVPVIGRTFTAMMEQLQEGYVASVAATAACNMEPIKNDNYGFDVRLVRPPESPLEEEVSLMVQLKSTTTVKPDPTKEYFSYRLSKREYLQRLSLHRTVVKAILIVMVTSRVQAEWTDGDHDSMTLKHCCYWQSLEGHPVDPLVSSPSVRISTVNIFNATALTEIMNKLSRGESL